MNRQGGRGSMVKRKESGAFAVEYVPMFTCVVTFFRDLCRLIRGNEHQSFHHLSAHCTLFSIHLRVVFFGSFCLVLCISVKKRKEIGETFACNAYGVGSIHSVWHAVSDNDIVKSITESKLCASVLLRTLKFLAFSLLSLLVHSDPHYFWFWCFFILLPTSQDFCQSVNIQSDVVVVVTMDYVRIFDNRFSCNVHCALNLSRSHDLLSLSHLHVLRIQKCQRTKFKSSLKTKKKKR